MAIADGRPLQIADEDGLAEGEVVAEIDLDEMQEARKDPKWMSFRDGALAYRSQLQQLGRSA